MAHDLGFEQYTYKAKSFYDNEWVEGNIVIKPNLEFVIIDFDGNELSIWPETICKPTGFQAYHYENNKLILDCLIYHGDIVEVITRCGGIYKYIVWFNQEMNHFSAVNLEAAMFNGYDYYNETNYTRYEDFCFLMQDPWNDVSSVTVIGNTCDNLELLDDVEVHVNVNSDILDF